MCYTLKPKIIFCATALDIGGIQVRNTHKKKTKINKQIPKHCHTKGDKNHKLTLK